MPSFAELRAKAEAAANSAKVTANSKLAAYRGDEKPAKPVYKPPPPRPVVKPDVPLATRPRTPGVPEDEEDEEDEDEAGTKTEAIISTTTVADDKADLSPEIQALIKNKLLFFEFLDEYFANNGYQTHEDVGLDTSSMVESQEEEEAEAEPELHPPEPVSQNIAQIEEPMRQEDTIPPPLPPSGPRQRARPPVPRSSLPPTPETHARKVSEEKTPDPPSQIPVIESVSIASNAPPPVIRPTPAPGANAAPPQDMHSPRKERPLPAASTVPLLAPSSDTEAKVKKGSRFSKLMKMATTLSPSTSTASAPPPPPPPGPLPPPVPSISTKPSTSNTSLPSATLGIPPPTFSSDASGGEFDYMPKVGRTAAENECSAARFVQYFHHSIQWDPWYASEDANARPPSLVGTIETRWRGSVMGTQETKRRFFSEKTSAMEWARVGYVLFQDHSMAWYRVTWKEDNPVGSLQREARWRPQPTPWNGSRLYAAHTYYGQAIADFCEQAVHTGQFVDRGEPWDMANGAIKALATSNPNAPSAVPSVGHCHGHLIYEGLVGEGRGWGSTRGGDIAVRTGDILEWCNAELHTTDAKGKTSTLRIGASGFISVIVSAFEFPDRLEEDQHTLPPYRLPPVDIIEQSARNGKAPSKRTVSFKTMTKGRIWIFRPVPWDYLGFQAEPPAEWPPPEPTRSI